MKRCRAGAKLPRFEFSRSVRRSIGIASSGCARVAEFVSRRPLRTLTSIFVVLLISLPLAARIEIDNRVESWMTHGTTDGEFSNLASDFVAVIRPDADPASVAFASTDRDLSRRLHSIAGIDAVESVTGFTDLLGSAPIAASASIRAYLRGHLIAEPGKGVAVIAWIRADADRGKVVDSVRSAVALSVPEGESWIIGPAVFHETFDELSRTESLRLFPLAGFAVIAVLLVVTRSPTRSAVILVMVLPGLVVWAAIVGATGTSLDFVSIEVPVLGTVVGITYAFHAVRGSWESCHGRRESLRRAVLRVAPAQIVSMATTVAGFLSLTVSPFAPVSRFGWLGALACFLAWLSVFATLGIFRPALDSMKSRRNGAGVVGFLARSLIRGLAGRAPWVRRITVGAALPMLVLPLLLSADQDPRSLLGREQPLLVDYRRAEALFPGFAPLELEIALEASFWTLRGARSLERSVEALRTVRSIERVRSALDALRVAAGFTSAADSDGERLPSSDLVLGSALLALRAIPGAWRAFVSEDGNSCRVLIPLPLLSSDDLAAIEREIELAARAAGLIVPVFRGVVHQIVGAQRDILRGQLEGLAISAGGAFLALALFLRSWKDLLGCLITHALPLELLVIGLVIGSMPLDASTAMVAGVAVGLAVDDTVHVLWALRGSSRLAEHALSDRFERVSYGVLGSSLPLVVGFGVLGFAVFPPVARFGALTALVLASCAVSHLVVLPAFLARESRALREVTRFIDPGSSKVEETRR
jgi:predicted RND superfamily exporter protein